MSQIDGESTSSEAGDDGLSARIAERLERRFRGFEERLDSLESSLHGEVLRLRASAQAVDGVAEQLRAAAADRTANEAILSRLTDLERALERSGDPAVDPDAIVTRTRAEVAEALRRDREAAERNPNPVMAQLMRRLDDVVGRLERPASDGGAVDEVRRAVEESMAELRDAHRATDIAMRAALADIRPDLHPVIDAVSASTRAGEGERAALRTAVERLGDRLDEVVIAVGDLGVADADRADDDRLDALVRAVDALGRRIAAAEDPGPLADAIAARTAPVDLAPLLDAVRGAAPADVDLTPVLEAIRDLERHEPDLSPILEAIRSAAPSAGGGGMTDLGPVLDAIAEIRRDLSAGLADSARATGADGPIVVGGLDDVRTRLDAIAGRLDSLATGTTGVDATGAPLDLSPVLDRLAALSARLDALVTAPSGIAGEPVDLGPVLLEVRRIAERLDDRGVAPTGGGADLAPLRSTLDQLRSEIRNRIEPGTVAELAALRGSVREMQSTLEALSATATSTASMSLRERLEDLADRSSESANTTADLLSSVQRSLTDLHRTLGGVDNDSVTTTLREIATRVDHLDRTVAKVREGDVETEARLAGRLDAFGQALRERIDDQYLLTDSLGANLSQLNAALVQASEQPHQLRRDLDRTLTQLAEYLGGAMREMRQELPAVAGAEPLALKSSVESGLDRLSGKLQSDAGRILDALSSAKDDTDDRLRRIDNQMAEMRREIDRLRRDERQRDD